MYGAIGIHEYDVRCIEWRAIASLNIILPVFTVYTVTGHHDDYIPLFVCCCVFFSGGIHNFY